MLNWSFILCSRRVPHSSHSRPSLVWRCNFILGFRLRCAVLWSSLAFRYTGSPLLLTCLVVLSCCFPGGSRWQAGRSFLCTWILQPLCFFALLYSSYLQLGGINLIFISFFQPFSSLLSFEPGQINRHSHRSAMCTQPQLIQ